MPQPADRREIFTADSGSIGLDLSLESGFQPQMSPKQEIFLYSSSKDVHSGFCLYLAYLFIFLKAFLLFSFILYIEH